MCAMGVERRCQVRASLGGGVNRDGRYVGEAEEKQRAPRVLASSAHGNRYPRGELCQDASGQGDSEVHVKTL